MSKTINKVILVGNLARDPKTNQTKKGDYVCNATVATDTSPNNQPQFTDIVLWSKSAELFPQLAIKGSRVYIEGYLNTFTNQNRQRTEVVVSDFIVLNRLERHISEFVGDSLKDKSLAIQVIKAISDTYKHSDVLVVSEGGKDAERLNLLISKAFDGSFPYQVISFESFPGLEDRPAKKWLDEPKFSCEECGNECKTKRALKAHYTKKHPKLEKPRVFIKVSGSVSKKERINAFRKYLEKNPKEILILQRTDDSAFIETQKDIRPLKYLDEEDKL